MSVYLSQPRQSLHQQGLPQRHPSPGRNYSPTTSVYSEETLHYSPVTPTYSPGAADQVASPYTGYSLPSPDYGAAAAPGTFTPGSPPRYVTPELPERELTPASPTPSVEIVAVIPDRRIDYVDLVTPSPSGYSSGSEHSSKQEGERVSAHSSDYRVPSCPEGCGRFPGCGPSNTPSGAGAAAMCAAPADRGDEADSAGKQGQTLIIPVDAAAVPEINMCIHCHVDADGEVHIGVLFSRRAFSAL